MKHLIYKVDKFIDNFDLHTILTYIRFPRPDNNIKEWEKNRNIISKEKYKIYMDGKIVHLIIEEKNIFNKNPKFSRFKLDLISEENIIIDNSINNDDVVNISGIISYAISYKDQNGKKKLQCPIDSIGNFKDKIIDFETKKTITTKKHFLRYLEEKTGIHIELEKNILNKQELNNLEIKNLNFRCERLYIKKQLHNFEDINTNNEKEIKNVIYLNCIGIVKNKEQLYELQQTSIGRSRSYGLGNIEVIKVI